MESTTNMRPNSCCSEEMEEIADDLGSNFSLRFEDDSPESSPLPPPSTFPDANLHCDEDLPDPNQLHNGKTAFCDMKFDCLC